MKTNVITLREISKYLNSHYGKVSNEYLNDFVLGYYNRNEISFKQYMLYLEYIKRHEEITNLFATMYSENMGGK